MNRGFTVGGLGFDAGGPPERRRSRLVVPFGRACGRRAVFGKAQAVAAELPVSKGAGLADSASTAFTDALGIGFSVAAAFAIAAAVLVGAGSWRGAPRRGHTPVSRRWSLAPRPSRISLGESA
jgi:hypothetical protein